MQKIKNYVKGGRKRTKKILICKSKKHGLDFEAANPEFIGKCTMPGCNNRIYTDTEYFKDGEGNIFCGTDCILEWYGIEKV